MLKFYQGILGLYLGFIKFIIEKVDTYTQVAPNILKFF
jgi:hypothetical protein